MKRNDIIILIAYIIIGVILIIIGLRIQVDYYSSLIFSMGFGISVSSVVQIIRYYYHTRPENIETYREKVRQQSIDLNDERKVQIRHRAGYITWAATMVLCLLGAMIAVFLHANIFIVEGLMGLAILEYIVALIIYKSLCRRM